MIQSIEDFGSPSPNDRSRCGEIDRAGGRDYATEMVVDPHNWVRQPPWAPTTERVRPPFLGPNDRVPVPE